jgi:hypothetical protein
MAAPDLKGDFFQSVVTDHWHHILGALAGYYMMGIPGALAGITGSHVLKDKGLDGIMDFAKSLMGGGGAPPTPAVK